MSRILDWMTLVILDEALRIAEPLLGDERWRHMVSSGRGANAAARQYRERP
jgi:hypothetical protein